MPISCMFFVYNPMKNEVMKKVQNCAKLSESVQSAVNHVYYKIEGIKRYLGSVDWRREYPYSLWSAS